jgi:hypothetical protein
MSSLSIQSLLLFGRAAFISESSSCSILEDVPPSHRKPHPDDEGCKLLDSFAILVQITLATSALVTLFYKRSRERPQRPVPVW